MLDATAEALSNHLLTKLPADQPRSRAELEVLPIPIAHYLGSVLDRRASQKAAAPETSWLDSENEVVTKAREAWDTAARFGAQFPTEAWASAVKTASRQVLDYLVDPVETLVAFAYADGATELMADTLRERMASFSAYPYFREVAEGYIERKQLDAIERDEFEKLLLRIDNRMVADFSTPEWMMMLEPLFELTNSIPRDTEGVPASLLKRFFEVKGHNEIASRLDEKAAYDEAQLREALDRVPEVNESTVGPKAQEPEESGPEEPDETKEAQEIVEASASEASPEPLWQRLAREKAEAVGPADVARQDQSEGPDRQNGEKDVAVAPEQSHHENLRNHEGNGKKVKESSSSAEDADTLVENESNSSEKHDAREEVMIIKGNKAEPLWKQLANSKNDRRPSSADATAPSVGPGARILSQSEDKTDDVARERSEPLPVLETRVLGPTATERRDWYAGHLTGGSEAAYRRILENLDRSKDWNEAWPVLKEAYQSNKVEIYSDAIVAFTDAVEKHFST